MLLKILTSSICGVWGQVLCTNLEKTLIWAPSSYSLCHGRHSPEQPKHRSSVSAAPGPIIYLGAPPSRGVLPVHGGEGREGYTGQQEWTLGSPCHCLAFSSCSPCLHCYSRSYSSSSCCPNEDSPSR